VEVSDDLPDHVKRLPVRFKKPLPEDRTLLFAYEVGQYDLCSHDRFVIDDKKAEVGCGDCHEKLNPMWVLSVLTSRDHRFHEAHATYNEQMKRLDERTRTKCEWCDKLTRINRR
jgi:hypothetical protein